MELKLERVLTVSQVANLAGWSYMRMYRHLTKMDAEVGGMLLRQRGKGGAYTLTLKALQSVAPQWFLDPESIETRLTSLEEGEESLKEEVKRLRAEVATQEEYIVELRKKVA